MVVQFRGATLRAVFEARAALEPAIASLAAVQRTDADLARLDESMAALRAAEDVPGYAYAGRNGLFHNRVAEASHNEVDSTLSGQRHDSMSGRGRRGDRPPAGAERRRWHRSGGRARPDRRMD